MTHEEFERQRKLGIEGQLPNNTFQKLFDTKAHDRQAALANTYADKFSLSHKLRESSAEGARSGVIVYDMGSGNVSAHPALKYAQQPHSMNLTAGNGFGKALDLLESTQNDFKAQNISDMNIEVNVPHK